MKHLFYMNVLEGASIVYHLIKFNMVTIQLSSIKVDKVRSLLILCSFQVSWDSLVMVVSYFVFSSNTLKFDDFGVIFTKKIQRKSTRDIK